MTFRKSEFDIRDPDFVSAIDDLPLWPAPFGLKLFETVELRRGMRPLDVGPVFDCFELVLNDTRAKQGELEMTVPFVYVDCRKKGTEYA